MAEPGTIAVCGATGRQGGAVARNLLRAGWKVRALTRRPAREEATALRALGAEVVGADMEDHDSLVRAFGGVDGVYSIQNGMLTGFDREVLQGRNVAGAAMRAGVRHLVYGSAGIGARGTGVPSWEAKLDIEDHMRDIGLQYTTLRPRAFMELMTDRGYYPAAGTWRIWPRLSGDDTPIPWLAVEDLGAIAGTVFSAPDEFIGQDLPLAADVRTLQECRSIHRDVVGRDPVVFPMPVWLFDRFTRGDVIAMWRWLRTGDVSVDTKMTRSILPTAMTVREWLEGTKGRRRPVSTSGGGRRK